MNPLESKAVLTIARWITGVLVAIFLVTFLWDVSYGQSHKISAAPNPRICFPKQKWTPPAPDHTRPCVYVRVYEDGTYNAKVRQANGSFWFPR